MRIAFVSYEYPPETGGGGIGTYLECVAPALAEAGHDVVVFCGGKSSGVEQEVNPRVVRVASGGPDFASAVLEPFTRCHAEQPFDIVELTDFAAWGLEIQRRFPQLPTVVKLHTPVFLIDELHAHQGQGGVDVKALVQRLLARLWERRDERRRLHRGEMETLTRATSVAAPTKAVLERIRRSVPSIATKARVYPYPLEPPPSLLSAPCPGMDGTVTFLGRLEPRKGVLDLARALPIVCEKVPGARFRFIGRDMASGEGDLSCAQVITRESGSYSERVEILPALPREKALELLAKSDVCVFPSHWESFGIVTLEAMAAARAVIVTAGSGMAELVSDGETGLIVRPNNPADLSAAIIKLLGAPALRKRLGLNAREAVTKHFGLQAVLPAQLDHYQELMSKRMER